MRALHIRFLLAFHFFALGVFFSSGESKDKLFYDAVRAEASGDLDKAIEIYSLITEQGNSASLHANLANLYFKTEDYGRSVLHFRKAILIDPHNRDYAANLSLVYEMAGSSPEDSMEIDSSFSAHLQMYWLITLLILFWAGILYLAFTFRLPFKDNLPLLFVSTWVCLCLFLSWGFFQSKRQSDQLNREVIALLPSSPMKDSDEQIPLRVFAGNGSASNTKVTPGSSLLLDLGNDGLPRVHHGPAGEPWYLVRSLSGTNKGWLKRSEFEPVLDW
jgi:tetratricopeptide (TPR) repeat protein